MAEVAQLYQQASDLLCHDNPSNQAVLQQALDLLNQALTALSVPSCSKSQAGKCICPTSWNRSNCLLEINILTDWLWVQELVQYQGTQHLTLVATHARRRAFCAWTWLQESPKELTNEQVADFVLDWAVACKRSNNLPESLQAHLIRMDLLPNLKHVDAVRLLGIVCHEDHQSRPLYSCQGLPMATRQDVPMEGIFQRQSVGENGHVPTIEARQLGAKIRKELVAHGYTLRNCQAYVQSCLPESNNGNDARIWNAATFFQHRHDVHRSNVNSSQLGTLVRWFLCGLPIHNSEAQNLLGKECIQLLLQAGLIQSNLAQSTDWVATVMVFPLSATDFEPQRTRTSPSPTGFFCTDWPLESFGTPRDAIMSVGDDTLELLQLVAGYSQMEAPNDQDEMKSATLLDMCCGSGVQGLFAFLHNCERRMAGRWTSLVSVDINERAMSFVTANSTLNAPEHLQASSTSWYVTARLGNLWEALSEGQPGFDDVLCNPPFVPGPLPTTNPTHEVATQQEAARFAVGGGNDGMDILRSFLWDCLEFLSTSADNSPRNPHIFMVTEVPNVEDSGSMLQSFLPEELQDKVHVRLAYVLEDVETTEEYDRIRGEEVGDDYKSPTTLSKPKAGPCDGVLHDNRRLIVRNRALVLISLSRVRKREDAGNSLWGFSSKEMNSEQYHIEEEEDVFLTPAGIQFVRSKLLPC